MARLNAEQAETFKGNGPSSFLSLQNDKDSALVRFAYESADEVPYYSVHTVKGEDGRFRTVDCLRVDESEPVNKCPFCESLGRPSVVVYLQLRNEETKEMQIWQRSKAFFEKTVRTTMEEQTDDGISIASVPFKITRHGEKGDKDTTYTLTPRTPDGTKLDSFPDEIEVEGTVIAQLTEDEMVTFLDTGKLPNKKSDDNSEADEEVKPRRTTAASKPAANPSRRTLGRGSY